MKQLFTLLIIIQTGLSCFAQHTIQTETRLQFPEDIGFVDVTKPPYNADNTGKSDVTDILQKAIDDNSPSGWRIIYLPEGEYLISNQLKWGDNSFNIGPVLQGQGRKFTTIRLADNSPMFQDENTPKGIIWTGDGSADNFKNEIRDLTLVSGRNNPGACGIQFNANNEGCIKNVMIISEDGKGQIGLDMAYTDMIGPLFIKNVEIEGFKIGISTAFTVNSMCFEDIYLKNQKECGFRNKGQVVSIRHLFSRSNSVAIENLGGDMVLIDSELISEKYSHTAISNKSRLFVRNTKTYGYKNSIVSSADQFDFSISDKLIKEFNSHPVLTLYKNSSKESLNLPIKEIPEIPWDELNKWVNVESFGASGKDTIDDSDAIQRAIDNKDNKTTIYFPMSGDVNLYVIDKDVFIRGNIRRIFGANLFFTGKGRIIFDNGKWPEVFFERFSRRLGGQGPALIHQSNRSLVISDATFSGITGMGTGDLFMDNVVGGPHSFLNNQQHIWCRQLNSEQGKTDGIVNKGATLWVLGFKSEWDKIKFNTIDNGKTEILGGFIYALNRPKTTPMFRIENSEASFSGIRQSNFSKPSKFYTDIVEEVRNDTSNILLNEQTYHNAITLFSGYYKK